MQNLSALFCHLYPICGLMLIVPDAWLLLITRHCRRSGSGHHHAQPHAHEFKPLLCSLLEWFVSVEDQERVRDRVSREVARLGVVNPLCEIPVGFGHGLYVLEEGEVASKKTCTYFPALLLRIMNMN